MIWPFKRRKPEPESPPGETDLYDRAAENLIAQGVPPHKVARAAKLVKRLAKDGALPEGTVKPADEP
jgi:hypothetical protein